LHSAYAGRTLTRTRARRPERNTMSVWADSLLQGEADDDVLADLRRLFPLLFSAVMAADDDDDGTDEDESDDTDEDDDDEDDADQDDSDEDDADEDDEDGDKSKSKTKKKVDPLLRQARDDAARRRVQLRESREIIKQRDATIKDLQDKSKPADKKVAARLKELEELTVKQADELNGYRLEKEVVKLAAAHKVDDADMLGYYLDKAKIVLDEDGEWPDDVNDKIKRLKKQHPALVARGNGKEDDTDGDEEDSKPSVSATGKGRRRTKKVDKQGLAKKYPALAGRI